MQRECHEEVDAMTDEGAKQSQAGKSGDPDPRAARGLRAWVIVLFGALVAGYAISGEYLYHAVIGLDASAFPAGEWVQRHLAPGRRTQSGARWRRS
jgi:hypothetical protein